VRQRKRQVQFHPVVHQLGCDAAALAAFEADQAIAFHRSQRARQVRLGLAGAGDPRQLVQRAGRLPGDDPQQLAIPSRQNFGEGLGRSEPDLRLVGGDTILTARRASFRSILQLARSCA
jgi:hypothetical protein